MLKLRTSHINIMDIVLEYQERDNSVDIINPKDWEQIYAKLEWYKLLKKWRKFRTLAVAVTWASSDNHSTLDLGLNDDLWKQMIRIIDTDLSRGNIHALATSITDAAILFPQKIKKNTFDMRAWSMMEACITHNAEKSRWLQLADLLFSVKVITSAELAEIHTNIDEKAALRGMWDELQTQRHELLRFIRSAAKVKILFPEVTSRFQIDNILLDKLKHYRNRPDWVRFCHLAANLKILNADEVVIVNGSLKVMTKQLERFEKAIPPIPLQRKFL